MNWTELGIYEIENMDIKIWFALFPPYFLVSITIKCEDGSPEDRKMHYSKLSQYLSLLGNFEMCTYDIHFHNYMNVKNCFLK